jgi:lipid-A-disaccharide synthase-like uncharacterized protein
VVKYEAKRAGLIMVTLFIILWFLSGFIGAGFSYAYFQREFSSIAKEGRQQDTIFSCISILGGPLQLLIALLLNHYKHGWVIPGTDAFRK